MTVPLLEGLDGVNKMSKSLGNYVGINEPADAQFGKLMSVSDQLMWRYFELLSFRPLQDIAALRAAVAAGRNPRDVKFELAVEIVDRFHGAGAGARARDEFIARFQQGHVPAQIDQVTLTTDGSPQRLANVLKNAGLVASTSDGNRLIDQGAVRVGDSAGTLTRVSGRDHALGSGKFLIQVGKHKYRWVALQQR
jgi:tyrosyl-tRNA synthetase